MSEIRFLVSADGGATRARRALTALSPEVPAEVLSRLDLLLSEIVTHSPRHLGSPIPNTLEVTVEGTANTVRVTITDVDESAVATTTTERENDARWDILLLERLSDRWEVHEDPQYEVWFEIDRWHGSGRVGR